MIGGAQKMIYAYLGALTVLNIMVLMLTAMLKKDMEETLAELKRRVDDD